MTKITGSCLCGEVSYSVDDEVMVTAECYCVDCRKSSGTSHCTHVALSDETFTVKGVVSTYERPTDSGNIVSRSFCPECGSPLFSRNSEMPGSVFIRASCMDDPDAVSPGMTVYASRAPKWAQINSDGPVFADMPPGEPPITQD